MSGGPKTVWILGAGFSAPLGGPLFEDLVSQTRIDEALTRINDLNARGCNAVLRVFTIGKAAGHWRNAEDYLSRLEETARCDVARSQIYPLLKPDLSPTERLGNADARRAAIATLRDNAKRVVACACHTFLSPFLEFPQASEQWSPYLAWAKKLDSDDVLVSFNYDVVVEQLFLRQNLSLDVQLGGPRVPAYVPLYKLHGSVSWQRTSTEIVNHGAVVAITDPEAAVLGLPGYGKQATAKELNVIWDAAMKEISSAQTVILMGYRFPETDPDALMKFASALNRASPPRVGIVLGVGPGATVPATRLEQLVKLCGVKDVANTNLFTQDMLTLYDRSWLNGKGFW